MNHWTISRILPPAAPPSQDKCAAWPPLSTFTVNNRHTGEIRTVTCCGAGMLLDLIGQGRFDEETAQ